MRWWLLLTIFALLQTGCRAPAPTIDPFAPYGARVIPPPPTGSIGAPNGYMQPVPGAIPIAPGGTASGGLQPVPPVATQPAAPRTSSLPNQGYWESSGNGFGYTIPNQPGVALTGAYANNGYMPAAAPANYMAPALPQYQTTVADYVQPEPVAIPQPLPVIPSSVRHSVAAQPYVDATCCPPAMGDTVYIPEADPYLAASVPSYSTGAPSYATGGANPYYGSVTTAQATGWRRRR